MVASEQQQFATLSRESAGEFPWNLHGSWISQHWCNQQVDDCDWSHPHENSLDGIKIIKMY